MKNMNKNEITKKLDEILISISLYDNDPVYQKALLEDVDSLLFIQLVVEIESSFNIGVPDEKLLLENFKEKEQIVDIILEQLLICKKNIKTL